MEKDNTSVEIFGVVLTGWKARGFIIGVVVVIWLGGVSFGYHINN